MSQSSFNFFGGSDQFFVSKSLAHEYLGMEEVADGVWSLYFYDRLLARFDERDYERQA